MSTLPLSDLLRTNATALEAAVRGGRMLSAKMARALVADLWRHAEEAEILQEAARGLVITTGRRAA